MKAQVVTPRPEDSWRTRLPSARMRKMASHSSAPRVDWKISSLPS
jgi:hypothetical protein